MANEARRKKVTTAFRSFIIKVNLKLHKAKTVQKKPSK